MPPFRISASVRSLVSSPLQFNNPLRSQSAQFRFPFIDVLGDGYSTFSYNPTIFISNNLLAIAGAKAYLEESIVSTFDPPHDPYASVPGDRDGNIYFDVSRLNTSGSAVLNTTYRPHAGRYGEVGDYPLSL